MTASSFLAAMAAHGAPPAQMDALGAADVFLVQPPPAYNSWPMIQTLGGRHFAATYTGTKTDAAVFVVAAPVPPSPPANGGKPTGNTLK